MKKAFVLFALIGFATTTHAAAHKINADKEIAYKAQRSIAEVADLMGTEETELESFFGLETQTVKIYNAQDELIAEGELDFAGQAADSDVAKVLRNASRMMTMGDTHIYRTNN